MKEHHEPLYVHICFPGRGEILFTGPTPLRVRHLQKAFVKTYYIQVGIDMTLPHAGLLTFTGSLGGLLTTGPQSTVLQSLGHLWANMRALGGQEKHRLPPELGV